MDRVTSSFLKGFSKSFGFEEIKDQSLLFEHFVNYTIIEPKTEYHFDVERVNIGIDGTIGIDGFCLLLNKQMIESIDELNDFMNEHKKCSAEIVFIQSKTSKSFDSKEIGNFGFAVNDFIAESQTLKWSEVAIENIELFNKFVERISELKESPTCNLYYVALGNDEKDRNIYARVNETIINIKDENLFSKTHFEIIDVTELQKKYKKIGQVLEKSFEFPNRVTMPLIKNVKESYIGVIRTETIVDLMTDDEGNIISNVFYDNVRDYQGTNKVNSEIGTTLESENKDSFSILNNGITIVAEDLNTTRDNFTISNYQIINGCQTSHVLFEKQSELDETVQVPIKIVISENEELTSKVIRSTNRQTEVKEQDLIAFSNFQKRLEDYYATYSGNSRLYYERRSKQYNNKNVEKKRIIDKTTQMKSIASLYYYKPELATRYFGTLFNEFGDKLFKDNHEMFPYYVASFAFYKIESLFRHKKIERKYKKIKYHILTMIGNEINKSKCPSFESKKSTAFCQNIYSILNNDEELMKVLKEVIKKINVLDIDLNDNEISKSKELVKKILAYYR